MRIWGSVRQKLMVYTEKKWARYLSVVRIQMERRLSSISENIYKILIFLQVGFLLFLPCSRTVPYQLSPIYLECLKSDLTSDNSSKFQSYIFLFFWAFPIEYFTSASKSTYLEFNFTPQVIFNFPIPANSTAIFP